MKKTFDGHYQNGVRVSEIGKAQWTLDEAKYGRDIGTRMMTRCNAGGITGGKESKNNLVFHLNGYKFFDDLQGNLGKLDKKFREATSRLKKEGKKPQGFIYGGDPGFESSRDLLVVMKYFFEKHRIRPSVFWGSERINDAFYKGDKDTWFVLADLCKKKLGKDKVCESFEYIRISPEDDVNFDEIPSKGKTYKNLCKGELNLTIQDVLKKHNVDPEILKNL